jgi:hypothetical protein
MSSDGETRKSLAEVSNIMRQAGLDEAAIAAVAARWQPAADVPGPSTAGNADPEPHTASGAKYPNVRVRLSDLGADAGPIIRRVSYAMSDAGIEDAEIEQYKDEVRAKGDVLAVTRRWVQVER